MVQPESIIRKRTFGYLLGLFLVVACSSKLFGSENIEQRDSSKSPTAIESTGCAKISLPAGHHRAGHPEYVAHYAQRSNGCHYSAGFVGGGTQFLGCGRLNHEGTWGSDYSGLIFRHGPWLRWSHGRRSQGGTGAYRTDRSKPLDH